VTCGAVWMLGVVCAHRRMSSFEGVNKRGRGTWRARGRDLRWQFQQWSHAVEDLGLTGLRLGGRRHLRGVARRRTRRGGYDL
jgi:hypothetical protein